MDPFVVAGLAVVLLLLLLAAGLPVAFALFAAGALGIWMILGPDTVSSVIGRQPFNTSARFVLVIIPMFIAMGIFAKNGDMAEHAFVIAARWLRRLPGGLAIATVVACAGFAAVSGSSVATVATLGPVASREMEALGYDKVVAAGVVGAAGTLGVLIPPSVALVLFGIITGVSIGKLLIAGIVPGILSALVYAVAIALRARRRPERFGATAEIHPAANVTITWRHYGGLGRIAVLFLIVVGGIYTGLTTTTQAASLGALLALLFLIYDIARREVRGVPRKIGQALGEAARLTSMAFALLIGGAVFTQLMVIARVPRSITSWITGIDVEPVVVIILLLAMFIPLGMFLDPLSTLLVAIPLSFPVVEALGFDGVWFGILAVKMIEVGLITPPFGLNAFVVSGSMPDVSVGDAFRGVLWFLPLDILTIVVIFVFPGIVLWLPNLMA